MAMGSTVDRLHLVLFHLLLSTIVISPSTYDGGDATHVAGLRNAGITDILQEKASCPRNTPTS